MRKLIFIGLLLPLCLTDTKAQIFGYYEDAYLFSKTSARGTARMQAIGGAQVALGGDINAAYANPAGLGFNRSSVFTITPSLNFYSSETEYLGQIRDDSKANFNIANLGIIFNHGHSDEDSKFKGGSFAINLTRENNFHSDYQYGAYNETEAETIGNEIISRSSIVDSWIDQAWGLNPSQLGGELHDARNHHLITPFELDEGGYGYYKFIGDFPFQSEVVNIKGSQYQLDFAYGANYDDLLYFGAGLNVNFVSLKREFLFAESDFLFEGQPDDVITEISMQNTLDIQGTGISGTFGLIARPTDFLRLGISAVTPTYYGINEESTRDLITLYGVEQIALIDTTFVFNEDYNDFYTSTSSYNITTPFKLTTGAAFFFGKTGFISADVDFIDYSNAKIKSSDFQTFDENQLIKNTYQNTMNYRVGGELRLEAFRLRAGYAYEGDPIVDSSIDNSIQRISGGIGYNGSDFFIDVSGVHTKFNSARTPYNITSLVDTNVDLSPTAFTDNKNFNISVTLGFKFNN